MIIFNALSRFITSGKQKWKDERKVSLTNGQGLLWFEELVKSAREVLLGYLFLRKYSTHLEKQFLQRASLATWTVLDCKNHVTCLISGKAPFCTNNYPEQYNI